MADQYLQAWPVTDDEQARVAYYMYLFSQVRIRRVNFEAQWEEAAAICWPEYRNTFTYGHVVSPGIKQTQYQLDSKASIASHRFGAICDSIMTPHNLVWSKIGVSNKQLLKSRRVRLWLQQVNQVLWSERYQPLANFVGQNQTNWQSLGVFGNMGMRVEQLDYPDGRSGLSYRSMGVGETYYLVNHQGLVDGYIRHFRRDARQAYRMWGDKIPQILRVALEQNSKTLYNFFEICHPRTDWSPWEIATPKGKRWASCYLSVEGYCILEEGGYRTFPHAYGRYMVAPEEDYGRGPAQIVLATMKTRNAEKGVFLKQGHLAGDPAYLIGDDGLTDFKAHSGAFNYGGFTKDGRPLVSVLPTGEIQITKEMMDEEGQYIDDAFLVSLFQMLFQDAEKGSGQRSAREVVEYAAERGLFLSPTVGRQTTEYVFPMVDRELDVLSYLGKLPPMPPEMQEARGEYALEYTSPLAMAAEGQEVAGAMQTVDYTADLITKGADPALLDIFDLDQIIQDTGRSRLMRETWFASPRAKALKQKQRQDAAEREARAKEAPAQAAIMKAQAIVAKAQTGGNTGGTLSGVPQGQMPQIPGNPRGTPGMPGIGGGPGVSGRPAKPF